jgi:hypothetical protein
MIKRLPLVGDLSERAVLVVELSKYLRKDEPLPLGLRLTSLLYRLRLAVYAAAMCAALGAGAGVVYVSAKLVSDFSVSTEAKGVQPASTPRHNVGGDRAASAASRLAAVASEAGLPPEKVWLAEQGEGFEFYSNGARILTESETTGPERQFYTFNLEGQVTSQPGSQGQPVGIVYHLSEGDQLPFSNTYNASLQTVSRDLIQYSRDNRLYNYVIDRFGRIHRIVRDDFAANHAGNSVWSDGDNVFVNLSASFIGICLEGRSGAGAGPDGINEAQIYAARVLTAVLRSRHGISDANCVTHGLVSVNPSNRLIGYHTDWISGFPFEALGLSDKYETELIAISRFGFTYDRKYLAAAGGEKWPGLERSESLLKESAKLNGRTLEDERRSRWELYHRAYSVQRKLDIQKAGITG